MKPRATRNIVLRLKPGERFTASQVRKARDRNICIEVFADDILVGGKDLCARGEGAALVFQPIARLEEPGNDRHAQGEKAKRDSHTQSDMHVSDIEKAPAEA